MWKVVGASVVGSSHEEGAVPCQDACAAQRLASGTEELLVLALADGAGCAKLSHIGSSEAVQFLITTISRSPFDIEEAVRDKAREWMQQVLTHLATVAEREHVSVDELACTLLGAVVNRRYAVFFQIGDGSWVAQKDGALISATWPENGEYANITTFITTEGALDSMQFERIEGEIMAVGGFTDGMQRLALNFALRQPHSPFFMPMFASVQACDDETSLIAPLRAFLASPAVRERTDDDTTLVLASWRGTEGGLHGEAVLTSDLH